MTLRATSGAYRHIGLFATVLLGSAIVVGGVLAPTTADARSAVATTITSTGPWRPRVTPAPSTWPEYRF
jgi:hypothetical protein